MFRGKGAYITDVTIGGLSVSKKKKRSGMFNADCARAHAANVVRFENGRLAVDEIAVFNNLAAD